MSDTHNQYPLPITLLLAADHHGREPAVRDAISAVIRTVESGAPFDVLVAVLLDPWAQFRRTDVEAEVLRDAVGTGLRWVALPSSRAGLTARTQALRRFDGRLRPEAAIVAFVEPGELVVLVQQLGRADFVARARVARGRKGEARVAYPDYRPGLDLAQFHVLREQGDLPQVTWPRSPF